jgi:uncharacterized RDD family membrane protein YckC
LTEASSISYARPGIRGFAAVLDLVFILVPALLLNAILPADFFRTATIAWLISNGLAGFVYLVIFWSLWQATPGMLLAGIRLVTEPEPGGPNLARSGIRAVALLLAILPLGPGLLLTLRNRCRQVLHDRAAATLVVEDDEATKPLTRIRQELA